MPGQLDLRRRNALWRELRACTYPSLEFEVALAHLAALTRWNRGRILAGLGLPNDTEVDRDASLGG